VFDNSTDKSMDASVRAMRHASGMVDRLWELLEVECERVLLSSSSTCLMQTNGNLQADRLEAEATIFRREFVKMGEGFVEDMKKLHNTAVDRGSYVDRELSKAWDRMNCHRNDLEVTREALGSLDRWCRDLEEEKTELLARVSGMEAKLCRCHPTSPTLMGEGTSDAPFELEYMGSDDSYYTPPVAEVPMATIEDLDTMTIEAAPQVDLSLTGPGVPGVPGDNVESAIGTGSWIEEVMAEVDAVVERAREEFPSWEQVQPPVRQTCRKTVLGKRKAERYPHTMSTAVRPKRRQNFYLLEDDQLMRRRHHRALRGLGGYESSSESGSKGVRVIMPWWVV